MFVAIWEFTILPAYRPAFEAAYGPDGDWAQLFRRANGYVSTNLLRDADRPDVYLTLDHWREQRDYAAAMAALTPEYQELDQRCEQYTVSERRLGSYVDS